MKITEQEKKNLTIGIAVAIGGIVLYTVLRPKTESFADPTGNGTYIPGQVAFNAKSVAGSLYNAMKDMGTDEEAIIEILKPVNQTQFAQVVTAFGRKSYNTVTGNQYSFDPFSSLPLLGLKDWLFNELSGKEYAILRLKYPYHL
ncbi:hypothetical protein [Flavobacterium commune]|nr:hypothetical protein [Flavobacterium commune]